MFALIVARDTELNFCLGENNGHCLQSTHLGYRCAVLNILFIFHHTSKVLMQKTLFVRFLTFSKATGFLLPLHTHWDKIWDKTKVLDGNSLDIIFQGFYYTKAKINWFCKGILLPLQCKTEIWNEHKQFYNHRVKLIPPHDPFALPNNRCIVSM